MGVPGPKLLDDEKFTQDFTGISTPTFTTPNVKENAKLQAAILKGTPLFYFINPFDSHLLDGVMQGLWARTQSSPLETRYWSCVPYLLGEGQAMQYSLRPRLQLRHPRAEIAAAAAGQLFARSDGSRRWRRADVEFDLLLHLQTDPQRMPVENASVRWSEKRSPPVPAATLRLPRQKFDSPAQLAFASQSFVQPLALLARAPTARKPEPRAAQAVPGLVPAAPEDERHATPRTDGRRGLRLAAGGARPCGKATRYWCLQEIGRARYRSARIPGRKKYAPPRTVTNCGRPPMQRRARSCPGERNSCRCRVRPRWARGFPAADRSRRKDHRTSCP